MVNLEAIKYWVYTARAPCLYEYDQVSKKHVVNTSQNCESVRSCSSLKEDAIVPSSRKKQKKKLLASFTSTSSNCQSYVYFEKSSRTNNKKATVVSEESELIKSHLNVSSDRECGIQKRRSGQDIFNCTNNSKKNSNKVQNIFTSTPIIQNNNLDRNKMNHSKSKVMSRKFIIKRRSTNQNTSEKQLNDNSFQDSPQRMQSDGTGEVINYECSRNKILNNTFEDISDVSGFTANYIRSTKLMSAKNRKHILETRKISNEMIINNQRNNMTKESLNPVANTHVRGKSAIKKLNKSFSVNEVVEKTNIYDNNNTDSDPNFTTCDSSIEKNDERSKLHRRETNCHSSSEDESIFIQRSGCNLKNNSFRRKRRTIQNTCEGQEMLHLKSKLENVNGTMFYKLKKTVLGQKNYIEVNDTSINNLKSVEKKNKKNLLNCIENGNKDYIINRENGVVNEGHSAVSQSKSKSRNNTNIYFSDCDSDVSNEKLKYFV